MKQRRLILKTKFRKIFAKTKKLRISYSRHRSYQSDKALNNPSLKVIDLSGYTNLTTIQRPGAFSGGNFHTVILPSSLKQFAGFNNNDKIKKVISYSTVPPETETIRIGSSFSSTDRDHCIIYVPKGCKETYRNANGWKRFTNIIEMDDVISTLYKKSYKLKLGSTRPSDYRL